MKAVKLLGNKKLEIIEVKKPQITGGHALVKVMASSICRTDIDLLYEMPHLVDVIPGHEVAGIIEEINSPGDFKKGDRVFINCHVTCGKCKHCLNGDLIFCPALKAIGFDVDGGDAEYVLTPVENLRGLPDDITFEMGTIITDALGTAFHAVKKASLKEGDKVGITGMGPLGLMAVISVKYSGGKAFAIDIISKRLEQAKRFGADFIINPAEKDIKKEIERLTGGNGFDVVIDCSGSSKAINMGLGLLKERGRFIFVGVCTDLKIDLFEHIIAKEIELAGSRNFQDNELKEIFSLVRERPDIKEIITHRFSLENAKEAFKLAEMRQGLKIVLVPDHR
jgi:2-desacetyl-2-hydroxyethyl bacteriochlorophyllide A dehydrogenase